MILIDHANVPFEKMPLRDIVTGLLDHLVRAKRLADSGVVSVELRAYGGWYREEAATDARYEAAEMYQETCPAVIKHQGLHCRLSFDFAERLILPGAIEPGPRLTHTVVQRASPGRVQRVHGAACGEPDCELHRVRRWLRKKRACTREACPRPFSDAFVRIEQKQVDMHLALDFLTLSSSRPDACIAMVSDDSDLLPAVVAASGRPAPRAQLSLLRFESKTAYLDEYLAARGVTILKLAPPAAASAIQE